MIVVEDCVCGIYAINVTGKVSESILDKFSEKGVYIPNDLYH